MKFLPSIRLLLPAVVTIFAPIAAHAATLQVIEGEISVNQGQGFRPATGFAEVAPGDIIKAGRFGKANLILTDGTCIPVQDGSIITVGEQTPQPAPAQAQPAEAAASPPPPVEAEASAGGMSTSTILTGIAVAGVAVGAIAALSGGSSGGSSKPASP